MVAYLLIKEYSLNVPVFKYVNNAFHYYMKEVFEYASQGRINSRNNYARLKVPLRKTTDGRKFSHILVPHFGTNHKVKLKETLA